MNILESQSASVLKRELKDMADKCVACDICVRECAFLKKHGNPKQIAASYDASHAHSQTMAYECSLCSLCTAVCPVGLDPVKMFLEMRKNAAANGLEIKRHKKIRAYEKRGTSKRYSLYILPENCNTIFFPGCTLPGTRPKTTIKLIERLKSRIPDLGVVLDCCTKPSHDLGHADYFKEMFGELNHLLTGNNVDNILVACPNCYKIFQQYGRNLHVQTVYEFLSRSTALNKKMPSETLSVHDPCPMRFEKPVLNAVRELLSAMGYIVSETLHTQKSTLCCGEGGAVSMMADELATTWRKKRIAELDSNPLVTYCAGCAGFLSKTFPTHHLLDLFFEPEKTLKGKAGVSKAPFTYLNRLVLKRKLKHMIQGKTIPERAFKPARK